MDAAPLPQQGGHRIDRGLPSESDYDNLSLDQWLTKFGRIYGKRHDRHTTEYMISRLVEEVAELVNPMESQRREEIGPNLADVFSWICSIAYKLNIDLAELTWRKYGGPNAPRREKSGGVFPSPSLASFSQPTNLREWQIFISKLYQNENVRLTPMNALIAMMKDVGDLAMLNRKRAPLDQITSKLAAILAWTLAISELLRFDLATEVDAKYDDHCPSCHQATCDTDICHPLTNLFVSFGDGINDEEKYAVLDGATRFGFKTLVNASPTLQSTKDLSTSLDLINRSDAACVLLSSSSNDSEYRQFFEVLTCFSTLSKGNVWIFSKDAGNEFALYLEKTFSPEKIHITKYVDSGNLRALFEDYLQSLAERKREASKA